MPLDPGERARWQRADAVFREWLDAEPAGRADLLRKAHQDPELSRDLSRLIAVHDQDLPAGDEVGSSAGTDRFSGRMIGGWTLQEEIGRGGMSVVYRATRQHEGFVQQAAVKLMGWAALGIEGEARFERERRVLARLQHPHIAGFIDGGIASDGTPFLAMQYVPGRALLDHARTHRLGLEPRVGLMVTICDAVAHAHQNLIVHRDLKPSNVQVTAGGVPVLLDFGIAKLIDGSDDDTRAGMRALTPGYAAPEQVRGEAVSTATDVYGLGMVLRALCADVGRIPADLLAVIDMATREQPERRYPDARSLAEDLRLFLARRPVRAQPESPWYRFRTLLRRHRVASVAVALALAGLLGGSGVALWQARQANEQARRAEAAQSFLMAMISAGDREQGATDDPRVSTIIARGAAQLPALAKADPGLHADMASRLGALETAVGRFESAGRLLTDALARARSLGDAPLEVRTLIRLGSLANAMGDAAGARDRFAEAIARAERLPDRDSLLEQAASGYAYALNNLGERDEARATIRGWLAQPDRFVQPALRASLLITLSTIVDDAREKRGLLSEAQRMQEAAALPPADRLTLFAMLAQVHSQLNEHDAAVSTGQQAMVLAGHIYPGDSIRGARIANNLGVILQRAGKFGESRQQLERARAMYEAIGDQESPAYAALSHNLGSLLRDLGASEQGIPRIERSIQLGERQFGAGDRRVAIARRTLAQALSESVPAKHPAAESAWRSAYAGEPWTSVTEHIDWLIVGTQIAALGGDMAALSDRLAAIDRLHDPSVAPPAQRVRLLGLRALAAARRGAPEAASAFALAQAQGEAEPVSAFGARWRNAWWQAEHLDATGDPEGASRAAASALALLQSVDPELRSPLRERLAQLAALHSKPSANRSTAGGATR